MRTIVQIAALPFRDVLGDVLALCNDGSVWSYSIYQGVDQEWRRLADIPQDYDPMAAVLDDATNAIGLRITDVEGKLQELIDVLVQRP